MRIRPTVLLLVLLALAGCGGSSPRAQDARTTTTGDEPLIDPGTAPIDKALQPAPDTLPRVRALGPSPARVVLGQGIRSGLAFELDSGRVLWSRDPTRVLPIASLTKLMTALLVVEETEPRDIVRRAARLGCDLSRGAVILCAELSTDRPRAPVTARAPTPDDVFVCAWAAASGYGDPLDREPWRVADDVAAGRVTADWGAQAYGVVLDGDGAVDDAATEARRAALRQERFAEAKPWSGEEST